MTGILESLASDPDRARRVSVACEGGRWYEITRLGKAMSRRPLTDADFRRLGIMPTDPLILLQGEA